MHKIGHGTRNEFAETQARLIYGDPPEAGTKTEKVTFCRERRAPGSLVGLRAQESKRNTVASPQPPSGELAPLNPRRAVEYVRAIAVYDQRPLPSEVFSLSPLTQYILGSLRELKKNYINPIVRLSLA